VKAVPLPCLEDSLDAKVKEVQTLRAFLKERYSSAGDAFDKLFDKEHKAAGLNDDLYVLLKTQRVDRQTFEKRFMEAGYPGNAHLIFNLLNDTDEFLTRACFKFYFEESKEDVQTSEKTPPTGANGASGRSCQDECQSIASGSTADTVPRVASVESDATTTTSSMKGPISGRGSKGV
jgi:hypothetical protein